MRHESDIDLRIAALAGRQGGVVGAAQLLALGLDRSAIARRVRRGWLHLIHRGVYAVGHTLLRQTGLAGGDETPLAVNFYSDPDVIDILQLEDLLSRCDDIDLSILRGIASQSKYIDLAERLHISENTVKYRLRKMLTQSGLDGRDDLVALLVRFNPWLAVIVFVAVRQLFFLASIVMVSAISPPVGW